MIAESEQNALALFGSAARGDHDFFSDLDLLIVSDDARILRELKSDYDSAGWSCTAYSWSRLQEAANQGSLFVQHLKQEAILLSDESHRLAHLLNTFSPKFSYKRESDEVSSLIGNLIQHLPLCNAGPMWTLDVLSVGFRSLAVTNLANNGIYAFSNSGLADGICRIGIVDEEEAHQLKALRRYKSLYRKGMLDEHLGWADIFELIKLIDKAFALGLDSRCVRAREVVEIALADVSTERADSSWYERCRRVESALWTLKPRCKKNLTEFHKQRNNLFRIVQSPTIYSWHFTGGYTTIQQRLSDLAEMSAV